MTRSTTPTSRDHLSAHAALWVAQVAFGLFPLFGKWVFEKFDADAVAQHRLVFGSAVFFLIAWAVHGRDMWPRRGDLVRMQCCSLLGVGLNQALYLEGLKRSTSVHTGLMMMLVPLFTFVVAVIARYEQFSWKRGLGILIALAGACQIVLQDGYDPESAHFIGTMLLVSNTLCYAIYLVLSKPLMQKYPPLVVLAWMYVMSLWMLAVLSSETGMFPSEAGTKAWTAIGLILLMPTFLAYLLNLYALSIVPASTTAVYVFSQPLIAGVAGWWLLNETLGSGTALAAVCIFVGIWIVVAPGRGRSLAPAAD